MIGALITYFFQEIFKIVYNFYTSSELKWFICITFFILNFFSYYQNPTLFTDSSNCYGMSCRWFNFIAGMGNLTLNLIGLIAGLITGLIIELIVGSIVGLIFTKYFNKNNNKNNNNIIIKNIIKNIVYIIYIYIYILFYYIYI